MPKYSVLLTRQVEQVARVYVNATDAEEAQVYALELCDLTHEDGGVRAWHESGDEPHSYSAEAELSEVVDCRYTSAAPVPDNTAEWAEHERRKRDAAEGFDE